MFYNRKFALHTLGCKLNFSESSAISRILTEHGYQGVDFAEIADYYIVNTCSVTEQADKKCRHLVRQILRRAPKSKVIIIGCYAQLKPEEIASIPGVAMVLGASDKFRIHEHLDKLHDTEHALVFAGEIRDIDFYSPSYSFGERTRSFLKVQDGCDYFCSFCTIPLARGKSRSASIEKTVAVAREVAATGVKEVVLTGVNIGDFGRTEDGKRRSGEDFLGLIRELEKTENIQRWRISSIEPNLLNEDIIRFVGGAKHFMPHFHIPLQSGSNRILKLMRRKYERELYAQRVHLIRELIPDACIGVDVIVGFPGETEEDFMDTFHFIHGLDVSYLHVFTYSERENTKALELDSVVSVEERRRRNEMLRNLSEKKKRAFYERYSGTERDVLFEAETDEGYMYGFTDNYIKVRTPYREELVNSMQRVLIGKISPFGVADVSIVKELVEQNAAV